MLDYLELTKALPIYEYLSTGRLCHFIVQGRQTYLIRIVRIATNFMKKDIHPTYYKDAKIICACGNVIEAGSTVSEMKVEICSACHPFYTGKKKLVDTKGRVDRFKKLAEKAAGKKTTHPAKKERPKKTKAEVKKVVSKKKKKK